MNSFNQVILLGNLGEKPTFRSSPGGMGMASASLATTSSWQDKQTKERKEKTEWHRVVWFGRLAEVANQYLHKGSKVFIQGNLQTRSFKDKTTGQDRYVTEVVVNTMNMLDGNNQGGSSGKTQNNQGGYQSSPPNNQPGYYNPNDPHGHDDVPY